jgi:hypothetical protein
MSVEYVHHKCISCLHAFHLLFINVGDSPEGPLKQPGKSYLKPAKKPKRNTSHLSAHTGHGPHCGGPHDPPEWPTQRPPRAGSASLEGSRSLERVPPRSRVHASLERVPPRSRVRLRLARGSLARTPVPARGYGHLML